MVTYIIRRIFMVILALAFFISAAFFLVQAMPSGPHDKISSDGVREGSSPFLSNSIC